MRSLFIASLLLSGACSSAYADQRIASPQSPGPRTALAIAPEKIRAPYDVQVLREDGESLPTYAYNGRFYVQGDVGGRYVIRVTNPTPYRVEAVVSVDGLDAIDGENGDLHKRGYIVPPWGEVRVEGFRTSLEDVATFRFSSVDGSYAGQKGKARNVGVIAVALFEEEHAPEQQIVTPVPQRYDYDWTDDVDAEASRPTTKGTGSVARADGAKDKKSESDYAPAKKPSRPADVRAERVAPPTTTAAPSGGAPSRPAPPPHRVSADEDVAGGDFGGEGRYEPAPAPTQAPTQRPGLGTEYGESRYSAASYTRFVRSTQRPIAVAELRYNDAAGLMALGIPVQPMPDSGEIMLRETADPFPGDHFARPVR